MRGTVLEFSTLALFKLAIKAVPRLQERQELIRLIPALYSYSPDCLSIVYTRLQETDFTNTLGDWMNSGPGNSPLDPSSISRECFAEGDCHPVAHSIWRILHSRRERWSSYMQHILGGVKDHRRAKSRTSCFDS